MSPRSLFTPKSLVLMPLLALLVVAVACGGDTIVEKEVVVTKVVEKEVTKVVEKEVTKEVPVEVTREVEVTKEVEVEVTREVD